MKKLIIIILIGILIISGLGANAINNFNKNKKINYPSFEGTEYWALLVGCNEFMNRPDLDLPGNDLSAEDFRDLLLMSDHWQPDHIRVLTGSDASSINIIRGLRWLDQMDDEDDICLFYIATHAGPLGLDFPPFDEEDGDECLTTYSSHRFFDPINRVSIVIPWISYLYDDEINLLLNLLDAQGICAVFNTCYAGGFDDSSTGSYLRVSSYDNSETSASLWMSKFGEDISASGRVVLMACEEDDLSLGSIFSYYLMEGLQGFGDTDGNSYCSAEESFTYALPKTKEYLSREFSFNQVPQIYDDYSGDLILTSVEMPPDHPNFIGPITGKSYTDHTFSVSSNDPEGDNIRYYVNWGDDNEGWTDYYPSGAEVILPHSWDSTGTYNVWFENEDEYGASIWEPACLDRFVVTIEDDYEVDQRLTETYEGQCYNDAPLTDMIWLAQSFIPTQNVLSKVELEAIVSLVYSEEPGPLHVSIRNNLTGEDLTSVIAMPMQIDNHMMPFIVKFKWTMFDFPDIDVIPGQKYYIVCRFESDSIGTWTYAGVGCEHDQDYDGDPYPNGEAYYSQNSGCSWKEFLNIHDFCFITYGW